MPDPLDPMDAVIGGFADSLKRVFAFLAVSGGASVLGGNMHEAPAIMAALPAQGPSAFLMFFDLISAVSPLAWVGMMLHSVFIWYLLPFALLYVGLFIRLWRDGDMFTILLILALAHSVHTFIYAQHISPLATGDLILASALLVGCEIAIAVLLLWWRHVSENAPVPTETEPEL